MNKLMAVLVLLLRFAWALLTSSVQTAAVIVRGRGRASAGFVRMRFAPMNDTGAALLGGLVTLTPGTTTIDIDLRRRELLLHVLDASDPEATVAAIRSQLEPCVVTLFGTEGR